VKPKRLTRCKDCWLGRVYITSLRRSFCFRLTTDRASDNMPVTASPSGTIQQHRPRKGAQQSPQDRHDRTLLNK
jgi:hypothetical protein